MKNNTGKFVRMSEGVKRCKATFAMGNKESPSEMIFGQIPSIDYEVNIEMMRSNHLCKALHIESTYKRLI